ncbi:MAG: hypothetical protein R2941_09545 [Desulfobacterales bacterium]
MSEDRNLESLKMPNSDCAGMAENINSDCYAGLSGKHSDSDEKHEMSKFESGYPG